MTTDWIDAVADPDRRFALLAGRAELHRESIGPRIADRHLIWALIAGTYSGEVDGAGVRLAPGDLLWMPPGTDFRLASNGPVRKYFLRLDMAITRPSGPHLRRAGREAEDWCAALVDEQAHGAAADPRRLRALLVLLCSAWQRAGEQVAGGLSPERRARLIAAVEADPSRRWSRSELGTAIGISGLHLARQARRSFGVPLRRWLVEARIRAASRELAGSDVSVTEVAGRYGYADLFLFSRQFRMVMGRSPRDWRRQA